MPDAQIARLLKKSPETISRARKMLGIAAWRRPPTFPAEHANLLGTASDIEIAERLGVSVSTVWHARNSRGIPTFGVHLTPQQIELIGTMSDHALAKRLGCLSSLVASTRERLGIPAFQTQKRWTPQERALLGTMSAREVAARVGRSISAVRAAKRAMPKIG